MQRTIELASTTARGATGAAGAGAAMEPTVITSLIPWHTTPFWESIVFVMGILVSFLMIISLMITIYNSLKWSGKERRHRLGAKKITRNDGNPK